MINKEYDLGVIVARMQTPILHAGHLTLIGTVIQHCEETLILLGTQDNIDSKNPYTFKEREELIKSIFSNVYIGALQDLHSDKLWSEHMDTIIGNFSIMSNTDNPKIALFHSRDSFKDSYSGKYPLVEIPEIPGYSATKIREQFKNNNYDK